MKHNYYVKQHHNCNDIELAQIIAPTPVYLLLLKPMDVA